MFKYLSIKLTQASLQHHVCFHYSNANMLKLKANSKHTNKLKIMAFTLC